MKISFFGWSAVVVAAVIVAGCSTDQSSAPDLSHPDGWSTVGSDSFHGTKVLQSGYASCKTCHGTDLKGGRTEHGCFDCHPAYPHPAEWVKIGDSGNHAAYVVAHGNSTDYCKNCHGSDLRGGESGRSCFTCHQEGQLP